LPTHIAFRFETCDDGYVACKDLRDDFSLHDENNDYCLLIAYLLPPYLILREPALSSEATHTI
jgi:hypothetical protein